MFRTETRTILLRTEERSGFQPSRIFRQENDQISDEKNEQIILDFPRHPCYNNPAQATTARAKKNTERYRSGYNGLDSKECEPLVSPCQRKQGATRLFRTIRSHFVKICLPVFLHFSGSGKNPVFTAYRRLNIKLIKYLWSGIEAVITALTRNQVYQQWYRGFESHPLRQIKIVV